MGARHTISGSGNVKADPRDPGIVVKGSGVTGQNLAPLSWLLSI